MRIGIIAPPWIPVPPPSYGGTEEVVDVLARGLHAAGHDVLLAAAADSTCPVRLVPGAAESDSAAMGTSVTEVTHVVRAYAAMWDVDIIHDNTTLGPLYRHRPPGVPVVSTNHALPTPDTLTIRRAMAVDVHLVAISRRQAQLSDGVPIATVIHHAWTPLGSRWVAAKVGTPRSSGG